MTFTVQDLLLSEERAEQLTTALANLGVADPLEKVVVEATAEVDRFTAGYLIPDDAKAGWIRILALHRAFLAAELPVPEDVETAVKAALEELTAIAEGKRPNLPLAPTDPDDPVTTAAGDWGSRPKVL